MYISFPKQFFQWIETQDGSRLRGDIEAWIAWRKLSDCTFEEATSRLFRLAEFRSLVFYRANTSKGGKEFKAMHRELRRANDLYIQTDDIGPGFLIQHGHSTWVFAERIGANCLVSHNVTIGYSRGKPSIGNNVQIGTGAVVVGPIAIGDRVLIAPNAFINFDVASDNYVFAPKSVIVSRKRKS